MAHQKYKEVGTKLEEKESIIQCWSRIDSIEFLRSFVESDKVTSTSGPINCPSKYIL